MIKFRLSQPIPFTEFAHVEYERCTYFTCLRCGDRNSIPWAYAGYVSAVKKNGFFNLTCRSCWKEHKLLEGMLVETGSQSVIEAYIAPEGAVLVD